MADMNHVILIGRLTRDAELRYTSAGIAVTKFAIAVNRRVKQGESWVDEANFFDVVVWGRAGESINQYLVKGKQVAVEGELHQNRWEQDGQSRSKVEINASNVQLLSGGQHTGQPPESAAGSYIARPQPVTEGPVEDADVSGADDVPPDFPDDIPF